MLHLTSQERKTIVFVLGLLILGLGIDFLRKTNRADLLNFNISQEELFDKADINKATLAELNTIPGVGEEMAQAIIDYRKLNGGFKNILELKNIKGIKEKKFEQLKKYITLETRSK